jgi:hypothetical protein
MKIPVELSGRPNRSCLGVGANGRGEDERKGEEGECGGIL